MNYDIRNISNYFREVHSRYYIDTNGAIYTSISENTNRIMVDGSYISINKFRKNNISELNNTNKILIAIPETKNKYYLMNNGMILQRLATRKKDCGAVDVCLIRVNGGNDKGNRYLIHRLLAGCFIGEVNNMEVHHKDNNRLNNNLNNLQIMTLEEHRGFGNFNKNHN